MGERLTKQVDAIKPIFKAHRNDQTPNAMRYIQGLLRNGLRNKSIERIAEADSKDYYSLQHFISVSTWKAQDLFSHTAKGVNQLVGSNDAALIFDESGMVKAGKASVGVERQYLGCVGKVENGQIGVFAALAHKGNYGIIDGELYLPKTWCEDEKKLNKAHVPEEYRKYRPVTEIAIDMLKRIRKNGVDFGYVAVDGGYGKNLDFSWEIDGLGEIFMTDIARDTKVFLKEPSFAVPEHSGRGRKPIHPKPDVTARRVDKIAEETKRWRRITVREGTKGDVVYGYSFFRAWFQNPRKKGQWEKLHLIIRRDISSGECKYSVSNGKHAVKKKRLAQMQCERYWVERSFQDAKNSIGMADYQVRNWLGWHHHMALVSFAMYFVLSEKLLAKKEMPLLSFTDITEIITVMVSQDITYTEALRRIAVRHRQRQMAIESAKKKEPFKNRAWSGMEKT